jgi:hypothetical protein
MLDELNDGRVQYFYIAFDSFGVRKYVFIPFCGEGVTGTVLFVFYALVLTATLTKPRYVKRKLCKSQHWFLQLYTGALVATIDNLPCFSPTKRDLAKNFSNRFIFDRILFYHKHLLNRKFLASVLGFTHFLIYCSANTWFTSKFWLAQRRTLTKM